MQGGLAQMVERLLSMREVPGSMPGFSMNPKQLNYERNFKALTVTTTSTLKKKIPFYLMQLLSILFQYFICFST